MRFDKLSNTMSKALSLFKRINLYPPFIGAGVRVIEANPQMTSILVEMKLRWWNKNIVGTQFGGSLYTMCDPFFMAILMTNLGRDYIVWDKAASIAFLRPGKSHVRAHFTLSPEEIERVRHLADTQAKVEPEYSVDVVDDKGAVIARVRKTLYVRKKDKS
jgi:acyl-coenzyme A thioesterase PaaI-like protein